MLGLVGAGRFRCRSMSTLVNVNTGQCRCWSMPKAARCRAWRVAPSSKPPCLRTARASPPTPRRPVLTAPWWCRRNRGAVHGARPDRPPVSQRTGHARCGEGCLARVCVYHGVRLYPYSIVPIIVPCPIADPKGCAETCSWFRSVQLGRVPYSMGCWANTACLSNVP